MRTLFLCLLSLATLTNTPDSKQTERLAIPIEVQESCEHWGTEYEICPELLEAMCWHETRCKPNLENEGCIGITQINPKYHKASMDLLGIEDLYDYDQNIHLCAYTMRQYADEQEDVYYALMCWNSGSTKGKRLFEEGKFTSYAIEVTQESQELELLHYGEVGGK